MRRASAVRSQRGAQVAVYDALLFLMVVILVSTGMFLYSAKLSADGPGFTGTTYQRLADAQLEAVMGQNLDVENTTVSNKTDAAELHMNLTEVDGLGGGPYTVEWALRAFVTLTARDRGDNSTWNLTGILDAVGEVFKDTPLEGTHFAWELIVDGTPAHFRSDVDAVQTPDDLPGNRWTSQDGVVAALPSEVLYHLWLA